MFGFDVVQYFNKTEGFFLLDKAVQSVCHVCDWVFFNLFSEVEPFAAILIAYGTRLFFWGGGSCTSTTEGREWGAVTLVSTGIV